MSTTNDIQQKVIEIIAEQSGTAKDRITPDSSLAHDLHLDSLGTVEVMMELEAKFDVNISDDEAKDIKTVQNVIDYIVKTKEEKNK